MSESESTVLSALELIKRFVDDWLSEGSSLDCGHFAAVVDALDLLRTIARQRLHEDTAAHVENMQPKSHTRALRSGTIRQPARSHANQGRIRSSRDPARSRIVSNDELTKPTSLFVSENETDPESNGEDMDFELERNTHLEQQPETLIQSQQSPTESPGPDTVFNSGQNETGTPHGFFGDALFGGPQPFALETETDADFDEVENMGFEPGSDTHLEQPETLIQSQQSPTVFNSGQDETGIPHDFFDEAFIEEFGEFVHQNYENSGQEPVADESELDTDMAETWHQDQPQSFSDDPAFKDYMELACRSNFRLPHESVDDTGYTQVSELLQPLMEERPLPAKLLHGLLYTLLPGSLFILELCSSNSDANLSRYGEPVQKFAAIVLRPEETLPLLVVGDPTKKTLFIIGSKLPTALPVIEAFRTQLVDWSEQEIDPRTVNPHVESTLLSVYIAEACFRHLLPIDKVPSSRDLRLRFLGELVAPYEHEYVLEQCGIPGNIPLSQILDTRVIAAQSTPQTPATEISIPNIDSFDADALRKAFLEKPSDVKQKRWLRILQCVNEIGSPHILDSLKLALVKPLEDITSENVEEPIFEKLFHIHLFLDMKESQSHISVARNRYVKYCYFETYSLAVKALQEVKRSSHEEQRRVSALKLTVSYKQGLCEELPLTPHTDHIHYMYKDLSNAEKNRRAPDVVKEEIARKVSKFYKEDEKRIRQNITRYLKEGKVLHHILQGDVCLNPGLLILFPSWGSGAPSLEVGQLGLSLQPNEQRSLRKPIEIRDIDGLTQIEAIWFGKVLQTRPALLEQIPKTLLNIISNSLTNPIDLLERDSDSFRHSPLHFFA